MTLSEKIQNKSVKAAVIGLGYVGLPLAVTLGKAGVAVVGYDVNKSRVATLNTGESHIYAVSNEDLSVLIGQQKFTATFNINDLADCDVIMICVPTPLDQHREPDLSYIADSARALRNVLRPEQLIVLESTTYPGTTKEVLERLLSKNGLKAGQDYYLAFAPEREDPGNKSFALKSIPKVVGADDPQSLENAVNFYRLFLDEVVPVSSAHTAEAVKLTENIFRSVNIALVNELKVIYDAMGIDIWEVIEAAKTKPFGYMPFYPGPGLGGHCIPIDPFYLSYRARAFDLPTRFIELAGEINTNMPNYVIQKLIDALDIHKKISLSSANILIIGVAYKKNVNDMRESPAIDIMSKLRKRGAQFNYHDPHVPVLEHMDHHKELEGLRSCDLTADTLKGYDAILIITDHDNIDFPSIAESCDLIVDTRNVLPSNLTNSHTKIIRA
ncbi:MAG: nucleotide sugar dehydrogenase [Alphaproteobacteria bacterium]